jgi:polysaccharide biosynthesis protein PslG
MQTLRSKFLLSTALLLLACAVAAGLVLHSESGGATVEQPAARPHVEPEAKPHPLILGISDPQLLHEKARTQTRQLAIMRSVGVTSVRLEANWDWVQFGGPRSFDWTQLDRAVHTARAVGLTVDLVVDGCPPWAALPSAKHSQHPQPASATRFAAWAADVARRYTPQGVQYFEIWNEPNDSKFWHPRANPALYAKMLEDSYRAIKTIDPSAVVLAGGLAPIVTSTHRNMSMIAFLRAIYAAGAKPYMSSVAVHPYCYPALPGQYYSWSAWSQMSLTTPSIRSVMRQHNDANESIWITEFGTKPKQGSAFRAAALNRAITIAKSTPWIRALYIYTIWQHAGAIIAAIKKSS